MHGELRVSASPLASLPSHLPQHPHIAVALSGAVAVEPIQQSQGVASIAADEIAEDGHGDLGMGLQILSEPLTHLVDGSHMKEWTGGSIHKKFATLMPEPNNLMSKRKFNNYTVHLELMLPYQPTYRSQDRGNSGFYQVHDYEIQVLDSFGMDGAHNECGGIYSHKGSHVNMCLPPLVWQTFDVEFTNAIVKDDRKIKNAVITVRQNGVVIHNKFEIPGRFIMSSSA